MLTPSTKFEDIESERVQVMVYWTLDICGGSLGVGSRKNI
jgi:hypothetical protein